MNKRVFSLFAIAIGLMFVVAACREFNRSPVAQTEAAVVVTEALLLQRKPLFL